MSPEGIVATDCGGELFVEVVVWRIVERPWALMGGKELFLGRGARGGCEGSKGGGGGSAEASGNRPVIGDASDKPETPEVGVRRVGLTAGAVPAYSTGV